MFDLLKFMASKFSVRKTQENRNWQSPSRYVTMAHTRGLRGWKHTGKIPARQTHRLLHDGSGRCVFFCCYRPLINFTARASSVKLQTCHPFFCQLLHIFFQLVRKSIPQWNKYLLHRWSTLHKSKKEPGKDLNPPVPRGNIRHTSRVVSLRKE